MVSIGLRPRSGSVPSGASTEATAFSARECSARNTSSLRDMERLWRWPNMWLISGGTESACGTPSPLSRSARYSFNEWLLNQSLAERQSPRSPSWRPRHSRSKSRRNSGFCSRSAAVLLIVDRASSDSPCPVCSTVASATEETLGTPRPARCHRANNRLDRAAFDLPPHARSTGSQAFRPLLSTTYRQHLTTLQGLPLAARVVRRPVSDPSRPSRKVRARAGSNCRTLAQPHRRPTSSHRARSRSMSWRSRRGTSREENERAARLLGRCVAERTPRRTPAPSSVGGGPVCQWRSVREHAGPRFPGRL